MYPPILVGDAVALARGFCVVGDAAHGCLLPIEGLNAGIVVKISDPGRVRLGERNRRWDRITGYSVVRVAKGEMIGDPYWYAREALCRPGSPEMAPPDIPLGSSVVLVRGHVWLPCAAFGPLRPGERGTIVERFSTKKMPYRVKAPNGESAWYTRGAVCLPDAPEAAAPAPASLATPIGASEPHIRPRPPPVVV